MVRKRIRKIKSDGQRIPRNKELVIVDVFNPATGETLVRKFSIGVVNYCDESVQSDEYRTICANVVDDITAMEMSVINKPEGAYS